MATLVVAGPARAADDHAVALALVAQLAGDPAHAAVTGEALAHAKDALDRADRLRSARDEAHARAADGLAREWAEAGVDLTRAADAEARAAEVARKATEAQARLERVRALVEEGVARVGRLRAELEEAGKARGQQAEKPAAAQGRGKK